MMIYELSSEGYTLGYFPTEAERIVNETHPINNYCIMSIDQLLRRNDEITAVTEVVIRRGEELVAKMESGEVKPGDPQAKEVFLQFIELRRIRAEFSTELRRLIDKYEK